MNTKQKEHFWNGVDKSGGRNACWPWTRATNDKGYGVVNLGDRFDYAHRIAFRLSGGRIGKRRILRSCDCPACCNPKHLRPK